MIGFDFFVCFIFVAVCAREWPTNFTCIEFYLLKDIKRISIFTIHSAVLAFFDFHFDFFWLFICLFCTFALRIVNKKMKLFHLRFSPAFSASYSQFHELSNHMLSLYIRSYRITLTVFFPRRFYTRLFAMNKLHRVYCF